MGCFFKNDLPLTNNSFNVWLASENKVILENVMQDDLYESVKKKNIFLWTNFFFYNQI